MGHFDHNRIVGPEHDFNHDGRLSSSEDSMAGVRWSEIEEEANAYAERNKGFEGAGGSGGCAFLVKGFVVVWSAALILCVFCSIAFDSGLLVAVLFAIPVAFVLYGAYFVLKNWL